MLQMPIKMRARFTVYLGSKCRATNAQTNASLFLPNQRKIESYMYKHPIQYLEVHTEQPNIVMQTLYELLRVDYLTYRWTIIRIYHECEGRIDKSVPRDHRLSSLGKPRDAKW